MRFWYPVCDHPDARGPAWYAVDQDGYVYRAATHPLGLAEGPAFRVVAGRAYPNEYETNDDGLAWYSILGSIVTPAEGHPLGKSDAPWYQLRN